MHNGRFLLTMRSMRTPPLLRCSRLAAAAAVGACLAACSATPTGASANHIPVLALSPPAPVQPAAGATASDASASVAAASVAAYTLAVGDEFDVRMPDAPQYDQTVKVRPDGKVDLSLIGTVEAAGRSAEELQAVLRDRYRAMAGSDQQREYLIHANDELEIKLPYYPNLNDQMRVRPDGKIDLQLAGTVQAEGLSPEQLEAELKHRYAVYLREPELTVIVRTATSQMVRTATGMGRGGMADLQPLVVVRSFQAPQVFISGELPRPGMVPYVSGLTLLQVLAESGGQLPSGDVTKLIILRRTSATTADVLRPGLTRSFRTEPTRDVLLAPYDVIVLPPSGAQKVAEWMDKYVYKIFAPLKNSSFSYVYAVNSNKLY